MPVYAAIDVGTNSVKLHVGERGDDGSWRRVVDLAEATRLGEDLREGGDFTSAAIERTVDAVAGMAEEAKRRGASTLVAVGTMGLRIARNTDTFIAAVRERCGVDVEIIPGEEEARLAYIAVFSDLDPSVGSLVVFDTGGGSAQVTVGRGTQVQERFSLNLGAVRLTGQFGLDGPVTLENLRKALDAISGELAASTMFRAPKPSLVWAEPSRT